MALFESLSTTVSDRRPGKLRTYIEGLDKPSRAILEAALANPAISSSAIRTALLGENFRIAISTIVVYRVEAALARGKVAA